MRPAHEAVADYAYVEWFEHGWVLWSLGRWVNRARTRLLSLFYSTGLTRFSSAGAALPAGQRSEDSISAGTSIGRRRVAVDFAFSMLARMSDTQDSKAWSS